jgi:hypothetical protein
MLPEASFQLQTSQPEQIKRPSAKGFDPDFLGVGGSLLCILHCLMPQFMAMGFVGLGLGSILGGEIWTLAFWISCFFAVYLASKKSVFLFVKTILWIAFGFFSLSVAGEILFHLEHWVSLSGSAILIGAHFFNLKKQNNWQKFLDSSLASR